MAQLKNNNNRPCWATFPCFYRKNNLCTFRAQAEATFDYLAETDPENRTCYRSMIGALREPCLDMDEERRQLGVADILGLQREQ